jgi:hypothetical protein
MPTGTQGLYRSEAASGARYARVKHGDEEVDIPEAQYRAEGHQPVFDELLSKEEYDSSIPLAQIRPHSNPP